MKSAVGIAIILALYLDHLDAFLFTHENSMKRQKMTVFYELINCYLPYLHRKNAARVIAIIITQSLHRPSWWSGAFLCCHCVLFCVTVQRFLSLMLIAPPSPYSTKPPELLPFGSVMVVVVMCLVRLVNALGELVLLNKVLPWCDDIVV